MAKCAIKKFIFVTSSATAQVIFQFKWHIRIIDIMRHNRGTMGVNSLPKVVTRQRRDCDLNAGPSAPESSMLTTRLPMIYSQLLLPQREISALSCMCEKCKCWHVRQILYRMRCFTTTFWNLIAPYILFCTSPLRTICISHEKVHKQSLTTQH